jgi:kynureninase
VSDYRPAEAWALEQDRADPLAWCRGEFELPTDPAGQSLIYFCGNSLGLMPRIVRRGLSAELDAWAQLAVEGYFEGPTWYRYNEMLQASLARVVGAERHEVVAMNALTINLHLMMVSFYRPVARRRKVLVEAASFPSDAYAVASHLQTRGVEADAVLVARPRPGEAVLRTEDLEALLVEQGEEIALLWLGGVHYYTGQLLDIPRITRAAQTAGCVVGFDLAHAAGNVELRLHEWNVDFAVWCCYKYLNAGPGAIGACFVHERHGREPERYRYAGWWGNDPKIRFQMQSHPEFVPAEGVAGWQVSSPSILAMAPLHASLDLFDRVGMPALRAKSARLTGYLEFLLQCMGEDGVMLLTPREPAARGCQLSLAVPGKAERLVGELRQRGIVADYREPDVIRVAPVPLYNTFHEVWRFANALDALLREG